jgi:enoyl-CoA hydratase/carnithine racemase
VRAVGALVRCRIDQQVATITLDSPSTRNALSGALLAELHDALDRAESAARVIVLTHTESTFCAGADLKERSRGPVDSTPMVLAMRRLSEGPLPTIAAVSGAVRAGGIGLMASCDLCVVRPDVTFAFSEVRLGVAPAIISVPILRRCSWSHLAAPFLTGEIFDALRAERIGLVTHVTMDVAGTVEGLCEGIIAGAPGAVTATKRLLRSASDWTAMQTLSDELFNSDEGREGLRAFTERRPPNWPAPAAATPTSDSRSREQ